MKRLEKNLGTKALQGRAMANPRLVRLNSKKKRTMTQPTKDELRNTVTKLKSSVEKARTEARGARASLKIAQKKISDLEIEINENEAIESKYRDDTEKAIARFKDQVMTERAGRLKAEARANGFEIPRQLDDVKRNQEKDDRIEKLKSAVARYKEENETLKSEVMQLRDDLAKCEKKQ